MSRLVVLAALLAIALVPASTGATAGCAASGLQGRFAAVNGSAGAGSISYALRLKNVGGSSCTISGRPGLQLLDARGRSLPTHVVPDHRGTGTAVLVTVRPGHRAVLTARFSPDIPSGGEGNPCEPTAHSIRVTLPSPAHGTLTAPVAPATPVCEHGRLVVGLFHS